MTPNSRESNPEPFSFPEYYRTPSPVGPIVSPARSSSPVEPSLSPPRSYSPQRRSRDRVRRDPSKYRFSYERSRSQRTLSSDYHQNQQPSSSNSRGSRSLSPQTWETSRGFRLKNLRCLTLVNLPKHLKSRQLEVELVDRDFSCFCDRGIENCRLCSSGVLYVTTKFSVKCRRGEPHPQLLQPQDQDLVWV